MRLALKYGMIAFGLLLAFVVVQSNMPDLSTRPANPTAAWVLDLLLDWWFVGAILILAIVGLSYAKPGFSWVKTSFKTGGFWMALLTSCLVLATFFYLLSKIYPNAPMFQPGEGYGHIMLYFLLAGLMALVAANLKGKAWFVNFVLVILMFAMIGHRTADLLDPSGKLSARIASILSFGGSSTTQVAKYGSCSVSGQVTLPAGQVSDLNPQNCDIKLAYPNQCLALRRADWTGDSTWYRVCDTPGVNTAAPNNIRYAYSVSPVVMFVQRRPH